MIDKNVQFDVEQYKRVEAAAIEAFEDSDLARDWLRRANIVLGTSPIEYLNAGNDENAVLKILHAIAYGGVV